jgi:hypothetical protein
MESVTSRIVLASTATSRFFPIKIHNIVFCVLCNCILISRIAIPLICGIVVIRSDTLRDIDELLMLSERDTSNMGDELCSCLPILGVDITRELLSAEDDMLC